MSRATTAFLRNVGTLYTCSQLLILCAYAGVEVGPPAATVLSSPGTTGGGGSVTAEVWNLWADSVPIYATNGPTREPYTNLWDNFTHRFLAFDKDRIEPAGPDNRLLPANFNSNLVAFALAWYQPCAGVAGTNYSGAFTIGQSGCGGAAATLQSMQWVSTLTNSVPGRPIWYNVWATPTNQAGLVTTRDADWRVEYIKVEAVCQ
jgi:hypothetical protein